MGRQIVYTSVLWVANNHTLGTTALEYVAILILGNPLPDLWRPVRAEPFDILRMLLLDEPRDGVQGQRDDDAQTRWMRCQPVMSQISVISKKDDSVRDSFTLYVKN